MENIALYGMAIQSSLSPWSYGEGEANNALTGYAPKGFAFHTLQEKEAWWLVDLKQICLFSHMNIYLREGLEERNYGIKISISDNLKDWTAVDDRRIKNENNLLAVNLDFLAGRFVRLSVENQYLHLKKVEIFGERNLIKFRNGYMVRDARIHPAILGAIENNGYERCEIDYVLSNISRDDKILELGASIGGMSSIVCRKVQPAKYTAIEANKDLIEIITHNNKLNGVKIDIINGAVAKNDGDSDFYVHNMCWMSSLAPFPNPLRVDRINTYSLKSLLDRSEANFLICDIEGAEYDIFNENTDLSRINKICIEIHKSDLNTMKSLYKNFINNGFLCEQTEPASCRQYVYFFYRNNADATRQFCH